MGMTLVPHRPSGPRELYTLDMFCEGTIYEYDVLVSMTPGK